MHREVVRPRVGGVTVVLVDILRGDGPRVSSHIRGGEIGLWPLSIERHCFGSVTILVRCVVYDGLDIIRGLGCQWGCIVDGIRGEEGGCG